MTFHVGVSGVASRSRLTTPTRRVSVWRIVSAIGRIDNVFPVPVPATIPKPFPAAASSRISAPCCFWRIVGIRRPRASSIVSQAARVGAMTMSRPVGGSAATNAAWSGGRYLSVTLRGIDHGKCMDRTGCETALEEISRAVGELGNFALVAVVAFTLAVTVAVPVSVAAAFVAVVVVVAIIPSVAVLSVLVAMAVRAVVVRAVVTAIIVRTIIPRIACADDRKVSVPVAAGTLND